MTFSIIVPTFNDGLHGQPPHQAAWVAAFTQTLAGQLLFGCVSPSFTRDGMAAKVGEEGHAPR